MVQAIEDLEVADLTLLALAEAALVAPSPARHPVEDLLTDAIQAGRLTLSRVARKAITRLLGYGQIGTLSTQRLFTIEELNELTEILAATRASSEALGRAVIRDMERQEMLRERLEIGKLLSPERAIAFFADLLPALGIDPFRFGADHRRSAFTLAMATSLELLKRVKEVIRLALEQGKAFSDKPREVQRIMDEAGVSSRNPQYAEMVFRTNSMDAYNQGAQDEFHHPDVRATFPVWQYSNPHDSRSRPSHAARDGNYYPADVPFVTVRGTGIEDAANCRCTMIPVSRRRWAKAKAAGARIAAGYPDVP